MTFDQWVALSEVERNATTRGWNVYADGYWHALADKAEVAFREAYGLLPHIVAINHGVYHGGTLIIGVTTDLPAGSKVEVPDQYLGFQVMQFRRLAP